MTCAAGALPQKGRLGGECLFRRIGDSLKFAGCVIVRGKFDSWDLL